MRHRGTTIIAAVLALASATSPGRATEPGAVPTGVSPGAPERFAPTAGACPTFSWAGVETRAVHELVVYRVAWDGATDETRPALAARLPAGATGWTPSAERCLAPGRYAWSVRAGGGAWSAALLFEVAAAPGEVELAAALETLHRYLAAHPEGGLAESLRAAAAVPEPFAQDTRSGPVAPRGAGPVAEGPAVPAALSDTGVDRASGSPQTFNVTNSGGGGMTLQVDGVEVVTTATDQDTLGALSCAGGQLAKWDGAAWNCDDDLDTDTLGDLSCAGGQVAKLDAVGGGWVCAADAGTDYLAGNQLDLTGTTFDVLEGAGSDLDADLLDGLEGAAFAGAGHTHGFATNNTAVGDNALASNTSGLGNTAVGQGGLYSNTTTSYNTAVGDTALFYNTGHRNSALGQGALFSNTTGLGNTALGRKAGFHNTTASDNTAVGEVALYSNTTGTYNTAVGQGALFANTGHRNTALGQAALGSNTSGLGNTAVGRKAGYANTTGFDNTALGEVALFTNTEGYDNTAVGQGALFANSTGDKSTAVGQAALSSNTTGQWNTAVGQAALNANTHGLVNTAVGRGALLHSTGGDNNTAMGEGALASNTEGNGNTALGRRALYDNVVGNGNVAIGSRAGYYTTGDSNILIDNSGAAESYTIRIGSDQVATHIAGIWSRAVSAPSAVGVIVDITGKLGTTTSSRRFKEGIEPLGDAGERLFELRPVRFRFTEQGGQGPLQYGLIAEEVAEVFPDLVVPGKDGRPLTVRYHQLVPLLLNEVQRLEGRARKQEARIRTLARENREVRNLLASIEGAVAIDRQRPPGAAPPGAAVATRSAHANGVISKEIPP